MGRTLVVEVAVEKLRLASDSGGRRPLRDGLGGRGYRYDSFELSTLRFLSSSFLHPFI